VGFTSVERPILAESGGRVLKSETLCKEQSGWRFTENQGVTTINRNSATYMVTTSSLTTEMEAAT